MYWNLGVPEVLPARNLLVSSLFFEMFISLWLMWLIPSRHATSQFYSTVQKDPQGHLLTLRETGGWTDGWTVAQFKCNSKLAGAAIVVMEYSLLLTLVTEVRVQS